MSEATETKGGAARGLAGAFITRDPKMVEIVALLQRLADAPTNVLLSGESGTGKDLAAGALHYWGKRADQPLVKVDLSSIPGELMESELFGYERGAFTGARDAKLGKLELAGQGTLFLDQINEPEPALQAKLLRIVEDKSYERVGGTQTFTLAARIVASSTADLMEAVARNSFRRDLFHRLSVFWIQLPPLRERRGDIVPLAEHFLKREGERLYDEFPRELSDDAREALQNYVWPGNVRELKGVIERAGLMARGTRIEREHLPGSILDSPSVTFRLGSEDRPTLAEVERDYIERTLRHVRGNQTRAAKILGISRKALWEKRRRYGMD
ncbi:MAG: sigma-54 interaction domain-containing protein [Vicinamibacteria bacterium]